MHRKPSSRIREDVNDIVLPPALLREVKKAALLHDLEVKEVVARCFLLGFISFDRDLYIEDGRLFRKILYEDPRP